MASLIDQYLTDLGKALWGGPDLKAHLFIKDSIQHARDFRDHAAPPEASRCW